MNICLDNIVFNLQKAGGISVYWSNISQRLLSCSQNVTFIEQENANTNIFRKDLLIPPTLLINDRRWPRSLSRYLSPAVSLAPGTIFHSSYYRTHSAPRTVNIITVYDFTYERFRSGLACFIHHSQKKHAIQKADGIISISNSTKKDLLDSFPDTSVNKIKTIYLSASEDYRRIGATEAISSEFDGLLGKNVILFVGDRSGYKNFDIAVETARRVKDSTLVAVGGKPFTSDEQARVDAAMEGRFRHFAKLDNDRLNQLYNLALCLLYPSSYEGFGIPVLEAMQAGCPVVATNCSSLPEVCGDAGLMVTEISPKSFAEKIGQLANPTFRDEVVQRGLQQSAKFSWDHTFSETIEFYKAIHAQKCGLLP